jgi:hypothetical protein
VFEEYRTFKDPFARIKPKVERIPLPENMGELTLIQRKFLRYSEGLQGRTYFRQNSTFYFGQGSGK